MENQYFVAKNGIELNSDDLDTLGETSGLADDRVIAEFIRLAPRVGSSIARCIIPYTASEIIGTFRPYSTSGEMVVPNSSTGQVKVQPFRGIVGSRVESGTDVKKNWRDIRSAILLGATTRYKLVTLSANSSGNPRWDLVYAVISPDVNSTAVSRKVKDPVTGAIAPDTVSVNKVTTITVDKVTGTPAGSPTLPALPSDGGGNYYIPLAYVRVPNGFGATSTVLPTDILHQAPILPISRANGIVTAEPASSNREIVTADTDSTTLTSTRVSTWGSSGTRPNYYLSSNMVGEEVIWIAVDATDASSANWSHANFSVVDDSRNWTDRIFSWQVHAGSGNFSWTDPVAFNDCPSAKTGATLTGMGQSHNIDGSGLDADGRVVIYLSNTNLAGVGSGRTVYLYVADNALKISISGQLDSKLFIRLAASPTFNKS